MRNKATTMNNSSWRWFPAWLGAAMAVAFVVNGYMVYDALSTFPGVAGTDGFDLSNGYGKILNVEQQQAALGWTVGVSVSDTRLPVLHLADRAGHPISDVVVEAVAERPVGPKESTPLEFKQRDTIHYQTDTSLFSGQWDVLLTVRAQGHVFTTTQRLVVR